MNVTYQGEKRTYSESEKTRLITYTGTRSELQSYMDTLTIGSGNEDSSGEYISNVSLSQKSGDIWQLELTYTNPSDSASSEKPNATYGKKSAQLSCGLLSMPLESHPDYLRNWNYYLLGKSTGTTAPSTPSWWETAKYQDHITPQDLKTYQWARDCENIPDGWCVLKEPQKPGIETYDFATYQITESVKCKSANAAGRYAANIINTIRSPENTLGVTGGDWKCDNASVSYNGSAWIATMTYTRSGNDKGWDKDLYE